jgi:hypothetical protein
MWPARGHYPPVQLMNMAAGAATGNGQGHEKILRGGSHCRDITEIRSCGAESNISHRGGSKVEVDPFGEEVGR